MGYRRFLLRRLRQLVPTLLGLLVLIFVVARVIPGDPVRLALGPEATAEQVEALRHQLGLDRPLWVQFGAYLAGMARGEMGTSLRTYRDVARDIRELLPATLELVFAALLLAVVVGVSVGVVLAVYKDTPLDSATRWLAVSGVALPRFWVAILLQIWVAYQLGWFPLVGRGKAPPVEVTGFYLVDALLAGDLRSFWSAAWHLFLPALTLALPTMAQLARITRTSMLEVFRKPYMLVHRAYGVRPVRLVMWWGLRNGLTTVLTLVGMTFGALIENAFLVEVVFSWPGLSAYGAQAVLFKDFNAVVGVTLVIGVAFLAANFLVDVLYGLVDPKVRYE